MRKALEKITEVKGEDCILSDINMVDIYNQTTEEEVKEYNQSLQEYLDNTEWSPIKTAVSFFYLKCHLLENNLISK